MGRRFFTRIKAGLAIVFSVAPAFIYGQSYTLSPNDSIVAFAPFDDLNHFTIQQNNNSGNTLVLSWQQILLNIPPGWTANLCDNGHCYTDFPASGTMDSVFNTEYGMLSVGINPGTVSGTAVVRYAVWDNNTPAKKDTLTWIITSKDLTNIDQTAYRDVFNIFPNPAGNTINMMSALQAGFTYTIADISGREILSGISTTNDMVVPVEHLPNGIYTISITVNAANIHTEKIIIQH